MTRRNRATLILFSIAALLATGTAAMRGQSALDGFDPNANFPIYAIVVQPDGKILIGGQFTTLAPNGGVAVTRNLIARLNPDGTLDAAFDPNANANGIVDSIAVQADGKILVGGGFTSIGGQARNNIARLNPDGTLDTAFNPNASGGVLAIAVQADGKIIVGGGFNGPNSIGGQTRNRIARLDPSTGLADSFDPNANGGVLAIAVQADGKILVGGAFNGANSIGGQTRNRIARLDPGTGLADSFDPNANRIVETIAVQADGKILVGGEFSDIFGVPTITIGGQRRNYIARLNATTGLADSFNPNANLEVNAIVVQADGKILVGGRFYNIGGQTRNLVARLDASTGLADSFDPNVSGLPPRPTVLALAVQADGKIIVGGAVTTFAPNGGPYVTRHNIARLERDGRLDQTLNLDIFPAIFPDIYTSAVQPDGKFLIGGDFAVFTGLGGTVGSLARVNADGTVDPTFSPGPIYYPYPRYTEVKAIAVQADGKILAGGFFDTVGGQARNNIARLDAATGSADSFDPNANSVVIRAVESIAVQEDGKILVGGSFTTIGGQMRNGIARLDATTGLADSFDPDPNGSVYTISPQADEKILVSGGFTSIGGQARHGIARLDAATGLADSFDPNADGGVGPIAVQTDGRILVSGGFTRIGGQERNGIARLDAQTGLADSFNPNATGYVASIAAQADGKILVGGYFTSIGGQTRYCMARLDGTTGLADSFNPNVNNTVETITLQADGKILTSGLFTSVSGQERYIFARLTNDTAALQNLAVTQSNITWTLGGSSPQLTRVTFEYSTDNVNYTLVGNGTATGNTWGLAGLSFPGGVNFYIRARGYYDSGKNGSASIMESVRNAWFPQLTQLANISARLRVETGDNVLIGGFILTGTDPKKVIVRAIGPSLPVPGKLENPTLELYGPAGLIASNDNWQDAPNRQEIIDSTVPPTNDLESAILTTLPANSAGYTAIVRGESGGTGVGLVEVYDLDRTVDSRLANISSRGFAQTGDNMMIGGFIVVGTGAQRVIVRAIGPSLPVPDPLADPTLELYNSDGMIIASNDNWRSDQEAEIIASTVPPTNDLESAIVATLPPTGHTAIVRGKNGTTGVGLVEVYALP